MWKYIKRCALVVLCGTLLSFGIKAENAHHAPTRIEAPTIIKSSTEIIKRFHKISRSSAVKVIGFNGGHGSGSYVKINGEYFVITAKHVVDNGWLFVIQGTGTESVIGQVIYRSSNQDLALLRIPKMNSRKTADVVATNMKEFKVGDEVVYTGFPSSYELLTSVGIVSGYEEIYGAILLQGWAWPGSSGSGVLDENGKLVGVVVAIGKEYTYSTPQLIETLVYIIALNEKEFNAMKQAARK